MGLALNYWLPELTMSYLGDVSREMVDLKKNACRSRVFGVPGFHSSVCYDVQRSVGRSLCFISLCFLLGGILAYCLTLTLQTLVG